MTDRYLFGFDISLKCTGLSIYNLDKKEFVYVGSFNTEKIYATKKYKGLFLNGLKLKKTVDWVKELMLEYPPTIISIERGYSRYNNETQAIFRAHGAINTLLWNKPQTYYPPKSVKLAMVHGDATKEDVANAILTSATYNYLAFNNEDESDSCAVALTYLIDKGLIEWDKPSWAKIKKLRQPTEKKSKKKAEKEED